MMPCTYSSISCQRHTSKGPVSGQLGVNFYSKTSIGKLNPLLPETYFFGLDPINYILMPDGTIKTKLFEKSLALHLYIPPHSMHAPGVLTPRVFGSILRMFRLNSDEDDTVSDVLCFYHNFTKRGHKEEILKPLFLKATANARKFMLKSDLQRKLNKETNTAAARKRLYVFSSRVP